MQPIPTIQSNDAIYDSIAERAMRRVWGKLPLRYQKLIIPHIIKMMTGDLQPAALLAVQATGSGKSAIPQTISVIPGD